jgi:stearoyl-CoA desaturase (delta-9 desaturase)
MTTKDIEETKEINESVDWWGSIPFFMVQATVLLVFWVGFSWIAFAIALFLFSARGFGITGGFHRYFSHRSYKTSRFFQFLLGLLGTRAMQKGPLWWSAHHRHHHIHSDMDTDLHSPRKQGLWYAHVGWILYMKNQPTNEKMIRDWAKFPELRWLDRWFWLPPAILAVSLFFLGHILFLTAPQLGTNGFQMLIWAFFISTVCLSHSTFCINSLTHLIGRRRFKTSDDSRNSFFLAIICQGEGWHNNHHNYPKAERQGYYWWEIDVTHYILMVLSWLGLVWGIHQAPASIYRKAREEKAKGMTFASELVTPKPPTPALSSSD